MAAKTPDTSGVAAIDAGREVVGHDLTSNVLEATDVLSTALAAGAEAAVHSRNKAVLYIAYFTDIDDADTWATGFTNILGVAWQGDDLDGDFVNAHCLDGRSGTITFQVASAGTNQSGWCWVLVDREPNGGSVPFNKAGV